MNIQYKKSQKFSVHSTSQPRFASHEKVCLRAKQQHVLRQNLVDTDQTCAEVKQKHCARNPNLACPTLLVEKAIFLAKKTFLKSAHSLLRCLPNRFSLSYLQYITFPVRPRLSCAAFIKEWYCSHATAESTTTQTPVRLYIVSNMSYTEPHSAGHDLCIEPGAFTAHAMTTPLVAKANTFSAYWSCVHPY